MRHTVPRGRGEHIHLNSRISYQEYKLSDCINRASVKSSFDGDITRRGGAGIALATLRQSLAKSGSRRFE
jgi:hypothetical protein